MDMQHLRDVFAEELEKNGERGLAHAVRIGYDNSLGGTAAIRAMQRIAEEVAAVEPGAK